VGSERGGSGRIPGGLGSAPGGFRVGSGRLRVDSGWARDGSGWIRVGEGRLRVNSGSSPGVSSRWIPGRRGSAPGELWVQAFQWYGFCIVECENLACYPKITKLGAAFSAKDKLVKKAFDHYSRKFTKSGFIISGVYCISNKHEEQ
jgi:hypothetical protein